MFRLKNENEELFPTSLKQFLIPPHYSMRYPCPTPGYEVYLVCYTATLPPTIVTPRSLPHHISNSIIIHRIKMANRVTSKRYYHTATKTRTVLNKTR